MVATVSGSSKSFRLHYLQHGCHRAPLSSHKHLLLHCFRTEVHHIMKVTSKLCFGFTCGQIQIHILACLEHYLAIVHLVIYMHPKKHAIKKISIIYSWRFNLEQVFLIGDEDLSITIALYFIKQTLLNYILIPFWPQ